jgi:hypothetical protein
MGDIVIGACPRSILEAGKKRGAGMADLLVQDR